MLSSLQIWAKQLQRKVELHHQPNSNKQLLRTSYGLGLPVLYLTLHLILPTTHFADEQACIQSLHNSPQVTRVVSAQRTKPTLGWAVNGSLVSVSEELWRKSCFRKHFKPLIPEAPNAPDFTFTKPVCSLLQSQCLANVWVYIEEENRRPRNDKGDVGTTLT